MSRAEERDAVIIGSGQAAKPLAVALGRAGRKTVLVERGHVGGTCINYGCTPTKTMVASARVAWLARRAGDYGVTTGPVSVDLAKVRERKRGIVTRFRAGGEQQIESAENVELVRGEASFKDAHTLRVRLNEGGERLLSAESIFINAGCRPALPEIPGLAGAAPLDSTSIMELDQVPGHLVVIGGGYVGLEFGQMFRRFGSRVTILQRGPQLLGREDADVAGKVAEILREDGIEVLLESDTRKVEGTSGLSVRVTVEGRDGARVVEGTHLLAAVGRVPNIEALNLPAAGVKLDARGFIRVNGRLETNVPGIRALGDIKGGPAFTHISYDDYRVIRSNLLDGQPATIEDRLVPYTVYIDPQLGRIGLSEEEARRAGRAVRVAKIPMTSVARALETDETRGFMKAIVDGASDRILGCAVLGLEGGEIMSAIQIAMMGGLPYTELRDGVFAHPALMESLNTLFGKVEG